MAATSPSTPSAVRASDVYSGNVSRIAFAKAKEGGESGDINNPAGAINITGV